MSDVQRPQKRPACDRCRAQKLGCHREDTLPDDFCTRCVRSNVECITSSSKRPGRPTKHFRRASREQNDTTASISGEVGSCAGLENMPDVVVHAEEYFNHGSLDLEFDMSSAFWGTGDAGSVMTSPNSLRLPSAAPTLDTRSLDELTDTVIGSGFSFGPGSLSDHDHGGGTQLPPTPVLQNEPGLRISGLYRDLSQQISMLRSVPWDTANLLRITSVHDTNGESASTFAAPSPLMSISRSSAEFAELLRACQASAANGNETSSAVASSTSQRLSVEASLGMSDLLATISCHILIVSIYDTMLKQTLHQPMEFGPELYLGGIAVPTRPNMHGYLLFRVIESQLRPIEELLGLPSEFCVTRRREPSNPETRTGLFSGRRGQSLFTAVIQMELERTTDDRSSLSVIESLKENAKYVQNLDSAE